MPAEKWTTFLCSPPRSLIIIPTGSTKFNRNPLNNFGGESCEWTDGEAVSTFPVFYRHKWHWNSKRCANPPLYSENTQCEALSAASCHSYVLIFFSLTSRRLNVILKRETSAPVLIVPCLRWCHHSLLCNKCYLPFGLGWSCFNVFVNCDLDQ